MALRSLLRKMPALGLRSPAGPHMGPVHALSPARHMSSPLPPDPSPRLRKAFEKMDQAIARETKLYNDSITTFYSGWDKCDKKVKLYTYAVHAYAVFMVLGPLF
ncbi:uncharacterized protein LOC124659208 [Lolium rigidum]|uniref:uncharacterized protein LOC124659208 n=1 Tax=Lolium rigidum TaxID=89674 RepID=UPI001F5C7D3B|nr:uncharacterized protein LOC124659208 [Lolium rigidum]